MAHRQFSGGDPGAWRSNLPRRTRGTSGCGLHVGPPSPQCRQSQAPRKSGPACVGPRTGFPAPRPGGICRGILVARLDVLLPGTEHPDMKGPGHPGSWLGPCWPNSPAGPSCRRTELAENDFLGWPEVGSQPVQLCSDRGPQSHLMSPVAALHFPGQPGQYLGNSGPQDRPTGPISLHSGA